MRILTLIVARHRNHRFIAAQRQGAYRGWCRLWFRPRASRWLDWSNRRAPRGVRLSDVGCSHPRHHFCSVSETDDSAS
jgi:hypothetical protein